MIIHTNRRKFINKFDETRIRPPKIYKILLFFLMDLQKIYTVYIYSQKIGNSFLKIKDMDIKKMKTAGLFVPEDEVGVRGT